MSVPQSVVAIATDGPVGQLRGRLLDVLAEGLYLGGNVRSAHVGIPPSEWVATFPGSMPLLLCGVFFEEPPAQQPNNLNRKIAMTIESEDEPLIVEPPVMEAIQVASTLLPCVTKDLTTMSDLDMADRLQTLTRLVQDVYVMTTMGLRLKKEVEFGRRFKERYHLYLDQTE